MFDLNKDSGASEASWIMLTPEGASELRRRTLRASLPEPNIPALYLLPTRIHRLAGGLMICAAIARQPGTPFMANHMSFVFFGDSGKFKTTSAIIVSTALGGDPRRDLVLVAECTENNLLYVQDHGKRVPRTLLSAPIGIFDEYLDAESGVVKRLFSVLNGRPEISLSGNPENDLLRIGCVPALACNPKPGATLSEQTGIRDPMLTRCVAVDFSRVVVPKGFRGKSNELIARARALGPMKLPALRQLDESKLIDIVPDAVDAVLDPSAEGAKLVNCECVAQLVPAARSLLATDRDALAYVLFAFGEIWELRNWTKPTWREELARVIGVEIRVKKGTKATVPNGGSVEERDGPPVVAISPEDKDVFMEWRHLADVAARLHMTPIELEALAVLENERRAKGSSLAKAAAFEDARIELDQSAADGKAAMKFARDMGQLQVSMRELDAVGREVAKAPTGEGLGQIEQLVSKHGSLQEAIGAAKEKLAGMNSQIAQAIKDEKRATEFFVELRKAKEWIRRDLTLRPLYDRVNAFLDDRVRTFADRNRAQETEDEVTRLLHWFETLQVVVNRLRDDPLCDGVTRQVDEIINEEGFDRLREMGLMPPKKPASAGTDLATPSR